MKKIRKMRIVDISIVSQYYSKRKNYINHIIYVSSLGLTSESANAGGYGFYVVKGHMPGMINDIVIYGAIVEAVE